MTHDEIAAMFRQVQDHICDFLVKADGTVYREDRWSYEKGEGGGITRIWEDSTLLEKGGVNFSRIKGPSLPSSAATHINVAQDTPFTAMGVSLVLHPWNPFMPTIHMNIRFFSAGDTWWFGGGVDLTPYYPVKSEVVEFHCALRDLCERHEEPYDAHKRTCDEYFTITHRNEMRGVGGIFFDHLQAEQKKNCRFVEDLGMLFTDLYRPFLVHQDKPYDEEQRDFQLHRRARYAEFNLVYDRGTRFGLQSGGRIESILMSMPATAKWRYDWTPDPASPEAELTDFYLKPQDWTGFAMDSKAT
jgi:coproporphyrinogen III oxidase